MKSQCLVLHADNFKSKKNQSSKYKNPRIFIESKTLGPLDSNNIRIEVIYVGICGTDIHATQSDKNGFILTSAPLTIPNQGRILGHEGVGRIIKIGQNVKEFKVGDFVAIESLIVCYSCYACRHGFFNQCLNGALIGMEYDGLFSKITDIPKSVAYNINHIAHDDRGLKSAACFEPAGVAWLACQDSRLSEGDRVLIFGGGPIGYFCAMLAKLIFGASHIILVDPIELRRNHARKWCDEVYDPTNKKIDQAIFDVVIEASGYLNNINRIIPRINPKGRVALLARSGQPLNIDYIDHIITNAIQILGVRGHLGGIFDQLIYLYSIGKLPLSDAVTGVVDSIDQLHDVLKSPDELIKNHCKVLVKLSD
jgi:threonine 3-dehydrogenase